MVKRSICQEDITHKYIIYAPSVIKPKYIKQLLTELKGKIAMQ